MNHRRNELKKYNIEAKEGLLDFSRERESAWRDKRGGEVVSAPCRERESPRDGGGKGKAQVCSVERTTYIKS